MRPTPFPPTLLVEGGAERQVDPDRVTVTAQIRSDVAPESPDALRAALDSRRALRELVGERHPGAAVVDTAVRVESHMVEREERTGPATTETRWVEAGYIASCRVSAEASATEAAALVATFGASPRVRLETPVFALSAALERSVSLELDCEAIRDARARAEAMADAADCRVEGIVSIGERQRGGGSGIEPRGFAAKADVDVTTTADDLSSLAGELRPEPVRLVRAVLVRFRIESAAG